MKNNLLLLIIFGALHLQTNEATAKELFTLVCEGQFKVFGDEPIITNNAGLIKINDKDVQISGIPFFQGIYNHGNFDTDSEIGFYKNDKLTMGSINRVNGEVFLTYPMGAKQLTYWYKGHCKLGSTLF